MVHWHNRVNVARWFQDDGLTFKERRDGVAGVLEAFCDAKRHLDPDGELDLFVSNVRTARDEEDFDAAMADVYDWGDRGHRLWIDAHLVPEGEPSSLSSGAP
jgi:hypothetical protein